MSFLNDRFFHEWKTRDVARREWMMRELATRSGRRHRQRGFILNPFAYGSGGAPTNDIIQLLGEGANGGSTFTDGGTAGSTWTRSGANVTTSTAQFKQGVASIRVAGASDYLRTPYVSGNAITSGDFFIGFWLYGASGISSRYVLGIDTVDGNPGNRGWLLYLNISSVLIFYYSNGTTTWTINVGTGGGISGSTWYYVRVERASGVIYTSLGSGAVNSVSSSVTLHIPPTSPYLCVGAQPIGSGVSDMYVDMLQIKRANVYGGAVITTPPTSPV